MNGPSASVAASGVATLRLESVPEIDRLIFDDDQWPLLSELEQNALRRQFVLQAFEHHFDACARFRLYATRLGATPQTLANDADLSEIPQIPISVFKSETLLSVGDADIVQSFTSSGTSGTKSVVPRDSITLQRLTSTARLESPVLSDLFDGVEEEDLLLFNLGPSRQEAGDLWFSFVMALLEQVGPMQFYVSGESFLADKLARDVASALAAGSFVVLVGPPFLFLDLMRVFERLGIDVSGGSRLVVFTGGGWKVRMSEAVDVSAFRTQLSDAFGLENEGQVRDVFNQVEMNTLLIDCAAHRKHLPPWLEMFARDPETLMRLEDGKTGLISFYDSSSLSFPAFVIGDDLGWIEQVRCECGRSGPTLNILRRVQSSSHEGCSTSMSETLGRR